METIESYSPLEMSKVEDITFSKFTSFDTLGNLRMGSSRSSSHINRPCRRPPLHQRKYVKKIPPVRYLTRRFMISDPCRLYCPMVEMERRHLEFDPWAYDHVTGVLTHLQWEEARQESLYSYSRPTYSYKIKRSDRAKLMRPQDCYACCPVEMK